MSMAAQTGRMDVWLTKQAALMKKEVHEVLRSEAVELAYAVARITPPTTGGIKFSDPWGAQKKAGINAVRGDIGKVYATSSEIYGQMRASGEDGENMAKAAAKLIRKGDDAGLQKLLRAAGLSEFSNAKIGEFDGSIHDNMRNNSKGRVSLKRPRQIVRNRSALTQHRRKNEKAVGALKRGCLAQR